MSSKDNEESCETKPFSSNREPYKKSFSVALVKKETINTELSQIPKANETSVRTDFFGNIISKDKKTHKVTFSDQVSKKDLVETINISDKKYNNNNDNKSERKNQSLVSPNYLLGGGGLFLHDINNSKTEKEEDIEKNSEYKYIIKRRHKKTPIIKEEKNEDEESQTCACEIF